MSTVTNVSMNFMIVFVILLKIKGRQRSALIKMSKHLALVQKVECVNHTAPVFENLSLSSFE